MDEQLVQAWIIAKGELDAVKKKEMDARLALTSPILGDKLKGTTKLTVGNYIVSATAKINQKVLVTDLKKLWPTLTSVEKDAFKLVPAIVAVNLKDVPEGSVIFTAIEEKPGTPTIKVKVLKDGN